MILKNAQVMTNSFELKKFDVRTKGTTIAELGENLSGDETIDLQGKILLPGFIDTHIHGAYGVRINDRDASVDKMLAFEATQGVTSVAVTTASSSHEDLLMQFAVAKAAVNTKNATKILAIHAEGPYINEERKGAMTATNIQKPDIEKFDELLETSDGLLKIITVAPEVEGALPLIAHAVKCGVAVSMGHTVATYEQAMKAIEAGASRMTHTFNAARPLHHREPGVLGAALTCDAVTCEMICDYVHLHPGTADLIYRAKGADRVTVISDSGTAAGLDIAEFKVDGIVRYVKDGVIRLADGTIAGSAMTLLNGVQNLLRHGIRIEDVSKMVSLTPARAIGADDRVGSIAIGKQADFAVLDSQSYALEKTFIDGVCVFSR